jgi:2-dehydro-3-deoxyphosphogalactonate aldolase
VIKAWKAVLPDGVSLIVTGGITADNLGDYLAAGARGAGIGSALYKPGKTLSNTGADATAFVDAYRRATASH